MRYEYQCSACGFLWEEDVPMSERERPMQKECQECGTKGEIRKVITKMTFKLCGSCWSGDGYATHYGDTPEFKKKMRGE